MVNHSVGLTSQEVADDCLFFLQDRSSRQRRILLPLCIHIKIGSVNSYEDLYGEVGLLNEAMKTEKYANARVAVYQIPFVCFEKQVNDEGETIYIFRGLYTFGPDKGDKYTFGFDTDLFPDLLSIEGSDNSPLCTLFRVPWNNNVFYNEDKEAWQYNGANSWNFGEGELDKNL